MILPARLNGLLKLLAAVFILLTAVPTLYGRGAREGNVLSLADELIAEREYDQAIRLLSEYLRDNPDRFGDGQARLQRIIRIRERYNLIVNELLDILEAGEDDDDRILELSNTLLSIESPSNPAVRAFLDQVRYLAEFNTNRRRLERIFVAAREQLGDNNFSGALTSYASGLDIYQSSYFSSGYGQEAEDLASRGLEGISRIIDDFNGFSASFSQAARVLTEISRQEQPSMELLWQAYNTLSPLMEELVSMRQEFLDIQESFDVQLVILQNEHNVQGDRSFLSFASRLITGPSGRSEGMAGTLEQFWHHWVASSEQALANLADRSYSSGYLAMMDRNFSAGQAIFEETGQYVDVAMELTGAWNHFLSDDDTRNIILYGETVRDDKAWPFLGFSAMRNALLHLGELGDIGNRALAFESANVAALPLWQQGTIDAPMAISRELETRRSYQAMIQEIRDLDAGIGSEMDVIRNYHEQLGDVPDNTADPRDYLASARNVMSDFSGYLTVLEHGAAIRQYTIANGDLERRLYAREAEFNEANILVRGTGTGVQTVRYPSEGIAILDPMNQNLEMDIGVGRALVAEYAAEDRSTLEIRDIGALYSSAQSLLSRLLNLQSRSTDLIAAARMEAGRAASLRLEGDRLFQAAQAALARNDFNAARENLDRTREQYDASLTIQESSALRVIRDTQLLSFGADIVRIENEVVVRDVRDLLTNSRARYHAGNMEQAEELLVQAQNRWRHTNVNENEEVVYWLRLVRSALSVQSGRVIAPTAPLFAEMSQLLSDASRSFNEGVGFISVGRRQEGLRRFSDAMEKTSEVRLMFPMNHNARMLQLRIEQQTDPPAFNASFRERVDMAVAGSRARNAESFADLQDLAEINPAFPGIRGLVTQAEIDMGLRPPPPNPADLARSAELTRSANAHIASRDPVRYGVAQVQLEEAIRLNPVNTQAQSLMDQLQILMTGSSIIVHSSSVQEQYDNALQEFLQGNYLRANAIVEQLLQSPEGQRSTRIQDLKRRIDVYL